MIVTESIFKPVAGRDVDARMMESPAGLFNATVRGDIAMVMKFIKKGVDVNKADSNGWTPLMLASKLGHTSIVRELLDNGAGADYKNHGGSTALLWAATFGHADVVRLLVRHGADTSLRNNFGLTALDMATARDDRPSERESIKNILNGLEKDI
jgi:uncharacterized protein